SVARHLSHRTALVGGFRFALLWRNASEARTYSETSVDQDPALVERIRAGEITDGPGMRDQAGSFTPKMQLESGRFHYETRLRVVGQIQRHLMRGTGTRRGDGAAKAGDGRIQRHEPERKIVDDIVDMARSLAKIGMRRKCRAHPLRVVVVAGHEEERHGKRREERAQVVVFVGAAEVREVTGEEHRIRSLRDFQQVLDTTRKTVPGVDHTVGGLSARLDVHI